MKATMGYLYIDDDPLSRSAMKMIIEKNMQDTIIVFDDSVDFMQRLETLPHLPKVILLDIHMSPHNGIEVLQMIRTVPEYQQIPVIALTASVMNEEVKRLKEVGFTGAIGKPFSVRTLPDLLVRVTNGEAVWKVIDL